MFNIGIFVSENNQINREKTVLTQQNDEKHIPIYSQGTRTPDISLLSNERTEPGSLGKLFKFHPELIYFTSESELTCSAVLGNPLPNTPVSRSAP